MSDFDEFRLVVTPVVGGASGQWTVRLEDCAFPEFINDENATATVAATVTRAQLSDLRRGDAWEDLNKLKGIGRSVWDSTLKPLNHFLVVCRAQSHKAGRGLRLIVVRQGDDVVALPDDKAAVAELPIEAMCDPSGEFLALDPSTPISRALRTRPDRSADLVEPPLRILLVVARPSDKDAAQTADEDAIIRAALGGLGKEVRFFDCPTGTYEEFRQRVEQDDPHVIHFCGHGGYAVVGEDPSPRPHLCFVRADNGKTREVDAETLANELKKRSVRLVVLTACASAAPGPANGPYWPGALEGIAQRLVSGPSGVSATVAMQFDLEADAAVAFSKGLYSCLLKPGCSLDEAVTQARREVAQTKNVGHRAWVNPALYWRCKDGRVFTLVRNIDPASVPALVERRTRIDAVVDFLTQLPNLDATQIPRPLADIARLQAESAAILPTCLRFSLETAAPGGQVRMRLLLRITDPTVVTQVGFSLAWPAEVAVESAEVPGSPSLLLGRKGNVDKAIVDQPSAGAVWPPGEHEIGTLVATIPPTHPTGLLQPQLTQATITRGAAPADLLVLRPVLYVHRP